jgi:hypothetical protein
MTNYLPDAAAPAAEGLDEAVRNRRLRRADWRFLLPLVLPTTSICYGDAEMAAAVGAISASVIDPAAAVPGRCDLAVAVDPDAATLLAAWTALRPGGYCYFEFSGLTAGAETARRRVAAAGFGETTAYWPWPAADRCRAWIPCAEPAVSDAFFAREDDGAHGLPRRIVRGLRHRAARWRLQTGLTLRVGVTARKPHATRRAERADSPTDANAVLRRQWAEFDIGLPPTRIVSVLQTGGSRSTSKVVQIVFGDGRPAPQVVLKFARVDEAARGLTRGASVLEVLQGQRFLPAGIPRLLFRGHQSGALAVAETALPGVPISSTLARLEYRALAERATGWLTQFGQATAGATMWDTISSTAFAAFESTHTRAVDADVRLRIRRRLEEGTPAPPAACEHRDFSPWNVCVAATGEMSVLDWESAVPSGVAGLDLIYFLSHLSLYHDDVLGSRFSRSAPENIRTSYRQAWTPSTPTGAINLACLASYATAIGIDADAFHGLRLLTWLIHLQSEYAHLAADCGGTPSPDALRGGLFLMMLEEEMHLAGG